MSHSPSLTERYARALTYSAGIHATSHFVGAAEISELLSVSALILQAGGDEDLAIAGLLHDAVETCGGRNRGEDLRRRFGDRVADVVLTGSWTVDEPWQAGLDESARYRAMLDRLALADGDVLLVRLAVVACRAQQAAALGRSHATIAPAQADYYAACLYIGQQRRAPQAVLTPLALAVRNLHSLLP